MSLFGLRVLMAQDNQTNQKVVQAMLRHTGIDLEIVENGALAVMAVQERAEEDSRRFCLLLLDISMPEMDDPTAWRLIRNWMQARNLPRLPAVALKAYVMAHQVEGDLSNGFDACVAKPVRRAELLRTSCSIPDDDISPRRSALFMARSVLRDLRDGGRPC